MIPETVGALYAFLGLITPGLVYQLLRERARPALDERAFREASRIALTSAVLTTMSLSTLALLSLSKPEWFADAREWLTNGQSYVVANEALVARTVLFVVVLACIYAVLAHLIATFVASRQKTRIVKTDVWYQLFVEDVPSDRVPWVFLRMKDGTRLWGHVDFFTVGKPIAGREMSLKGPKLGVKDPAADAIKTEEYWRRISVRASEIALMKVTYEPKAVNASGHVDAKHERKGGPHGSTSTSGP